MISDLYDALTKAFKRYGCPAPIFLGEQFRAQHTVPLRVVLWQGKDSPADQYVPQNVSVPNPTQRLQYINPRPVATRRCGFSAELWATAPTEKDPQDQYRANLAFLDALVNQFVVALQQLASGIYEVQSGRAAAGNADASVSGLGYTLQCVCDVPVIDAAWPAEGLNECSKTWAYGRATAEVDVDLQTKIDPPTFETSPYT